MSTTPAFNVVTGPDPWPVTLKLAAHLRHMAEAHRGPELPTDTQTICLHADRDDRVVTMTLGPNLVQLQEGAAVDPALSLEVSFNQPMETRRHHVIGRESSDPTLERLTRGLLATTDASWPEAARAFWERHAQRAHMPGRLMVTAADGEALDLGASDSGQTLAISGGARALADLFTGRVLLTASLVRSQLFAEGTWETINAINGASQREGLGNLQHST